MGHKPIKSGDPPCPRWGDDGWALGELVQRSAQPIGGEIRGEDNGLALRVQAFIDQLRRAGRTTDGDEPLVEIEDLGEEPLRGRELAVSLREDLAPQVLQGGGPYGQEPGEGERDHWRHP